MKTKYLFNNKMYKCKYCNYSTKRLYDLTRHQKAMHKEGELKEIYINNTLIMIFMILD